MCLLQNDQKKRWRRRRHSNKSVNVTPTAEPELKLYRSSDKFIHFRSSDDNLKLHIAPNKLLRILRLLSLLSAAIVVNHNFQKRQVPQLQDNFYLLIR